MIRLVIFDAGGVLYSGSPQIIVKAVRGFLAKHGVEDFEKSDAVWARIDKLVTVGKMSLKQAQEEWLESVGLSKDLLDEWDEVERREIWCKFRKTPGIDRLLAELNKKYTLAVLSDTIGSKSKKVEELELVGVDHSLFEDIFTSHDIGACKPSKKAFQRVLGRFGLKPQEAVFVGDSPDELRGASRIGLTTIGFKCKGGDYNIKKLDQILSILQSANLRQ